jgi:hypothetical protein
MLSGFGIEGGNYGVHEKGGYLYVKVANERKIPTYSYGIISCTQLHAAFPGLFS